MGAPDLGLACRLVKACHCMYNLDEGFAADPYFPQVGFTAMPAHIEVNDLGVDACLVGSLAEGAVLAFRGTLLPVLDHHAAKRTLDWINDFKLALVPVEGLPGKVHAALGRSTQLLWPRLLPIVQELTSGGTPLIVTGHSKGALLACYTALRFALAGFNVAAVYTFGSPRVGNADFARAYGEAIRQHWRYESYDDIFPHLPPSFRMRVLLAGLDPAWAALPLDEYETVGTLQYIDWDGVIQGESPELEQQRLEHLAQTILTLQFERFFDNHWIPTGFAPVICKGRER
jgi:hypothetical protein